MIYQEGYKYRLAVPLEVYVPFSDQLTKENITFFDTGYVMYDYGLLLIRKGYAWDGASGPLPDTKRNLTPSLIHDVWYQMLRERVVPMCIKDHADKEFGDRCHELGTNRLLADIYTTVLSAWGDRAATIGRPILNAP